MERTKPQLKEFGALPGDTSSEEMVELLEAHVEEHKPIDFKAVGAIMRTKGFSPEELERLYAASAEGIAWQIEKGKPAFTLTYAKLFAYLKRRLEEMKTTV